MIYLDNNASTPLAPEVKEAIRPFIDEHYANPSSSHAPGRKEKEALENARTQVASLIGASPTELLFTSGGTESNNHVIKSVARKKKGSGRHIIISSVEHPAVSKPCAFLEEDGFETTHIPVDEHGLIDPQRVAEEIRPDTILISIMHANNEVGTIQPIREIADIAREAGVLIHTDAAQSLGKIPVNVSDLGVDFLSIAGHKVYAPKGIGALYIKSGIELDPLHHGAGHENGRRAGTEPMPALVGLGAACAFLKDKVGIPEVKALRDKLFDGLTQTCGDDVVLLGHPEKRLPNTLSVGFKNRIGGELLANTPEICASTGAACHSGKARRSATLAAMNVPEEVAFGAVRFSLGLFNTEDQIDRAVELLAAQARAVSY